MEAEKLSRYHDQVKEWVTKESGIKSSFLRSMQTGSVDHWAPYSMGNGGTFSQE